MCLEKAYDKVCRENLWRMLVRYKVGGQLLRAIQSFYRASQACVWVNGNSEDGSSFLKVHIFGKGV